MALDDFGERNEGPHVRFLETIAAGEIDHDESEARTFLVGPTTRVWIAHGETGWFGVNLDTRRAFDAADRRLVHVFVCHGVEEFEERFSDSADGASSLDWYAVSDDALEGIATLGDDKYHVNESNIDSRDYHDGRGHLQ